MQTYYVAGNLNHNGTAYKRGDSIELEDASGLLAAGVVQTDPIQDAPIASEPFPVEPTSTDTVIVGGQQTASGEPSLDQQQTETTDADADAQEVGPHAPTPAADAPVEAASLAQEAASIVSGFFGRKSESAIEPLTDVSKDL
jgi:hypothetical protein